MFEIFTKVHFFLTIDRYAMKLQVWPTKIR